MNTAEKVTGLIKEMSGKEEITEADSLQEGAGLDSLGMVMLLLHIEDGFEIELDESDMNPFDLVTVGDVVGLVEKYVGGEG